jgi:gamma-glutamylcyclotransferase (GGCT)/AIG2-like uncharacterized protein YtfP
VLPAAHHRTMPRSPDLLFVYGTLRPAVAAGWPKRLIADLDVVAAATVAGLLYDLGDYPGMVKGDGVVHGDLVRIEDDRLAAIDAYEECGGPGALYRREAIQATLADGTLVEAWAYFFNQPTDEGQVIPNGDYSRYRGGG